MFPLTIRSIYSMKSLFLPTFSIHLPPHRLFRHPFFCLHSSPPLTANRPRLLSNHPRAIRRCHTTSDIGLQATMPSESPDPLPEVCKSLSGEIHVIIGPMFAGKTTALLHRVQCAIESGKRVLVVKSDKDTRYGLDSVVSHDGLKMPCFALPELSILRSKMGDEAYNMLDVIGIDEAQFFEDLYDFCRIAADHDGKTVIVAGLDGDYLRRRFGAVLDIIPLADSLTKLTSRCELCGRPAFFTLRKTEHTEKEVIGGADVYMPVCRQHYVGGQVVIETTRHLLEARKVEYEQCQEVEPVSSF